MTTKWNRNSARPCAYGIFIWFFLLFCIDLVTEIVNDEANILPHYLIYEFVTFLWSLKFGALGLCVQISVWEFSLTKIKFRIKFMWRLSFLFWLDFNLSHTTHHMCIDNIRRWKNRYDGQNEKLYAKWQLDSIAARIVLLFSFFSLSVFECAHFTNDGIRCHHLLNVTSFFLLIFIYCLRWH